VSDKRAKAASEGSDEPEGQQKNRWMKMLIVELFQ
jgi:hypothetical protein